MIPEEPMITCGICGESSDIWNACHDENGDDLERRTTVSKYAVQAVDLAIARIRGIEI